jgi:hypothetical protein
MAPYEDGSWTVVFELEDDNTIDDIPNDGNQVLNALGTGKGFKTANAYFIGRDALNAIDYSETQICGGYRANDGCPRVKCYTLEESWVRAGFPANVNSHGFTKDMSKAIACIAGEQASSTVNVDSNPDQRNTY